MLNRFYIKRLSLFVVIFCCVGRLQAQEQLRFDSAGSDPELRFRYPEAKRDTYLLQLNSEHISGKLEIPSDELEKVLAVVQWTHAQWRHNGNNEPSRPDALTIIREAREGKQFRCVEYARVSTDALLAMSLPARVLALKTKDAATRRFGAGHVLTEVWLPGLRKWVLADAQFNLVPMVDERPLNAVELQAAITANRPVKFVRAGGKVDEATAERYLRFIRPYLFFFDTEFDQRMVPSASKYRYKGFWSLMLVPLGYDKPPQFQSSYPLDYMMATHSIQDFYQAPDAK